LDIRELGMNHIELDPHGSHVALTNEHPRGFEHGDLDGWKALDEKNVIETLNGGFDVQHYT
jgi:hypothetical protein